jgi:hypothetical protein
MDDFGTGWDGERLNEEVVGSQLGARTRRCYRRLILPLLVGDAGWAR